MITLPHVHPPEAMVVAAWLLTAVSMVWGVRAARGARSGLAVVTVPVLVPVVLGALLAAWILVAEAAPDGASSFSTLAARLVVRSSAAEAYCWLGGCIAGCVVACRLAWDLSQEGDLWFMVALLGGSLAGASAALGLGVLTGTVHPWFIVLVWVIFFPLGLIALAAGTGAGAVRVGLLGSLAALAGTFAVQRLLVVDLYGPLVGSDVLLDRVVELSDAFDAFWVAAPGMLAAVLAAAVAGHRAQRGEVTGCGAAAGAGLAISLAWMGGWAVMEPRRAALERLAAGERLVEDDQDLPQVRGLVHPPRAACVAQHPELRIQALWPGAEPASCAGRTSVVVPASVFASDLIGHRWGAPSVWLELFVRTGGRSVTAGPLQLTDRAVVDVQSVAENLPSRFDPEQGFAAQLDAWLRDQLGEREETELVSGNVWVVDTPRGSMMLLPGAGVTVSDPATRRETLGELLDAVERPRLVQVAGSAWTIQDALDLCMEVQTLDAREVPCVWVRR